jgi:hypothetical protein
MLRHTLTILCLLAGVGLVVAGAAWTYIYPPQSYWSEDQAREYVDASRALKAAAMREGRRADDPPDAQLAAAQARFDRIKTDLDRAIVRRSYAGPLLVAGGCAVLIAAVWLQRTPRRTD